jgi:aspartate kinase
MALIVQKYGGTSVATPERIEAVADKVAAERERGTDLVVVVSAMAGETDRLVGLAKAVCDRHRPNPREMDQLLASGEQVTVALLAMALERRQVSAKSFLGHQVPIRTDRAHTKARIDSIDTARLRSEVAAGRVPIVAGFQGVAEDGDLTTLGRGGSDTTAVALAAALAASECQIYTDVDGVYTTDPRVVPEARRLDSITFEEMLEMASLGSKVLQIRSVEFAGKYNVPLRVLSTFRDGPGTLISLRGAAVEAAVISGIAFNRDEAEVTLVGVPDRAGVAAKVLGPIAAANIEVDMIVQNAARDGLIDFTFTVHRNDFAYAQEVATQVARGLGAQRVAGDAHVAKVSLVGVGVRSHADVAARLFEALGQAEVRVRLVSTSEVKISVLLDEQDLEPAVKALHRAFGLEAGPALVGGGAAGRSH